jgi:hypothetical protein
MMVFTINVIPETTPTARVDLKSAPKIKPTIIYPPLNHFTVL